MQGVIYCGSLGVVNNFHLNLDSHGDLLYPGALFRQTKYKVMMTKEESTKIVNSMTPMTGVLVLAVVILVILYKCIISLEVLACKDRFTGFGERQGNLNIFQTDHFKLIVTTVIADTA